MIVLGIRKPRNRDIGHAGAIVFSLSLRATMITFTLTRSDNADGQVAIVLHLYRNGRAATVKTIATVAPHAVRNLFMSARLHLKKLGIQDESDTCLREAV